MEDAMILNKASFERGFAHGTVLKCEVCKPCISSLSPFLLHITLFSSVNSVFKSC